MNNKCLALRLNDLGIHRLLEHNYELAVLFLKDAVFLSKAILILNMEQEDSSSSHQCPPLHVNTRLDLKLDCIDLECYHKTITHEKFSGRNGPNEDMLVCKTAISIFSPEDVHMSDGEPSLNQVAIAASATYNLAVAFHLWALQLGSNEKLRMALYYYEVAYRLQRQQEAPESSSTLIMSTLNNVATIFHVLGDYGTSKVFLQELMAMLPYVRNTGQSMNDQNQGISWENILCSMLGPPSAASAA